MSTNASYRDIKRQAFVRWKHQGNSCLIIKCFRHTSWRWCGRTGPLRRCEIITILIPVELNSNPGGFASNCAWRHRLRFLRNIFKDRHSLVINITLAFTTRDNNVKYLCPTWYKPHNSTAAVPYFTSSVMQMKGLHTSQPRDLNCAN